MAYTQRYISKQIYIQLPDRVAMVTTVDILHQTIKVTECPPRHQPSDHDYVLDWPTLKAQHPDVGLGADVMGKTLRIKGIMTAKDMAQKLNEWTWKTDPEFIGYLTILRGGFFGVTNGFKYTAYRLVNEADSFEVGTLTPAPVQKGWFYGPKGQVGDSPIKNTILTRPYAMDNCWLGPMGRPVVTVDWIREHLKKNAGQVADPFGWVDEPEREIQPSGRLLGGRHVIIGGDS